MQIFEFNTERMKGSFENERTPSLLIDFINLVTDEEDWATKLSNSILTVQFDCLNSEDENIGNTTQILRPNVGPYTNQPILIYNHYPVNLDLRGLFIDRSSIARYRITLTLSGIDLIENEIYKIGYHLLLHKNYQIFCNGQSIGMAYITDHHPLSNNQKTVTVVPINRGEIQEGFAELQFQNHINLFVNNNLTDDQIIQQVINNNQLICNGNWTKTEI